MMVSQQALDAICVWAKEIADIRAVYIYGSRACGEANSDSDLDVALEIDVDKHDPESKAERNRRYHLKTPWQTELTQITGYVVHLEFYDEKMEIVYDGVNKKGSRIYLREDQR